MQGHIYQAIALTAFGNASLWGHSCDFWPNGSAFQFSKRTLFADGRGPSSKGREIAADPVEWLEGLRRAGVKGLRMHQMRGGSLAEDYNTVAFAGGGGQWLIESVGARGSDLWRCHSEVSDPGAADRRIWTDTYYRAETGGALEPYTDLPGARSALLEALPRLTAFARKHQAKAEFAPAFERAAAALESAKPLQGSEVAGLDLCPVLSLEAKQLLAGASAAWVFGGMGWWNDGSFWEPGIETEFRALSQELWAALVHSALAGANATFPASAVP